MDILWMIIGSLFLLGGFIGCFLPLLPGPPLAYVGLLIQQLKSNPPFTTKELVIWLAIVAVVTLLDYWIPIYGTKKFGGTKAGVWGATIGLLLGFFLGPWGIIIGPFVGAFVGELLADQGSGKALKAAWGSFVGFLFGTVLKLVVCGVMGWYLIKTFW
jgi:uncharacterized protein